MERTRIWHGHVKTDARDRHEQFIGWLGTPEATQQYAKFLLTGYTLAQHGDDLTVLMSAEEPPAIIRFLRNPRMWPDFWEYVQAESEASDVPDDEIRVRWRKG